MSVPGKKRSFGVKKRREPPKPQFVRPEGSDKPISGTSTNAGGTGKTMSPKRWAEREQEKNRGQW